MSPETGEERLPAHLEVASLLRRTESLGGFATVIQRGERDAGIILLVLCQNGHNSHIYERMPRADGGRVWTCVKKEDTEKKEEFSDYLRLRGQQDPDAWIVELDVAQGERLIG